MGATGTSRPSVSVLRSMIREALDRHRTPIPLHGDDPLGRAGAYPGWPWLLRLAAAKRYLRLKSEVLAGARVRGRLPGSRAELRAELVERVTNTRQPGWAVGLRVWILYPLVAALVAGGLLWASAHASERQLSAAFQHGFVRYCDLLHRQESMRALSALTGGAPLTQQRLAGLHLKAEQLEVRVIASLPDSARPAARAALKAMREVGEDAVALQQALGALNAALASEDRGYHVEARLVSGPCVSYLPVPRSFRNTLEALGQDLGTCRSVYPLSYLVERGSDWQAGWEIAGTTYPVHHVRRLDSLPVVESALGITYDGGYGSQVLLDRVEAYLEEAIVPSLAPRGRFSMFGLASDTDGFEDAAAKMISSGVEAQLSRVEMAALRRLASETVAQDAATRRARLKQTLLHHGNSGEGGGSDPLDAGIDAVSGRILGPASGDDGWSRGEAEDALRVLRDLLVRAVAAHEVRHQANQPGPGRPGLALPVWPGLSLPRDEAARRHIADEVSAYLTGIVAGEGMRQVQVVQLLSFALNDALRTRPEGPAGELVLGTMASVADALPMPVRAHQGRPLRRAFERLQVGTDAELGQWAAEAYEALFGEPVPAGFRAPD